MVRKFTANRPFQPPLRESLEPLALVGPFVLRKWRVGKSADVEQHLLDRHLVLSVGAELRNDLRDDLARAQFAFADQNPRRRRHDRLGAREDHVEGIVGRGLFASTLNRASDRAHRADFPVSGDRDLRRRQQAVLHFALGAIEQRFDLLRIETYLARTVGKMTLCGHGGNSLRLNCSSRGITHRRRFVIRTRYAPDLVLKSIPPCPEAWCERLRTAAVPRDLAAPQLRATARTSRHAP